MSKIELGKKYRIIGNSNSHGHHIGDIVTVKRYWDSEESKKFFEVHESDYIIRDIDCEPVEKKNRIVLVIESDGDRTNGRMLKNGKIIASESAGLYHSDTYDFETGASEVIKKLNKHLNNNNDKAQAVEEKKEKPELFNGDVVCIKNLNSLGFTAGKIYTFVDGLTRDDQGIKRPPCCYKITAPFEKSEYRNSFIPIVK